MIRTIGRRVAVLMAACGAAAMMLGAQAQVVPQPATVPAAQAFFGRADIESVRLSPSGRWLAVSTAAGGARTGVFVFDLETMKPLALAARFSDADIDRVEWVNDDMLVFSIRDNQLGGGDQRFWPGLYSVGRDGKGGVRQLVDVHGSFVTSGRTTGRPPLSFNHLLLHVPSGGGNEVIVGEFSYRDARPLDIVAKRLDVTTGRATNLALGSPPNVRRWMFDAAGEPRLVETRSEGRGAYHWRGEKGGNWSQVAEFPILQAPWSPRAIDSSGALYVTVSRGAEGTSELRRFDFAAGRPAADSLVSTPGFDFWGGIISENQGGQALGVRVTTDGQTTAWFEPKLQALQQEADKRLPGHNNRITCSRCRNDDMTAVVFSWSDHDPGQYFIYRGSDKSWRKLGNVRNAIDPALMSPTDMERVRMRDGLVIPVWVTRPARQAAGPRPAVVLVHGGPWVRGRSWQWDADVQFLASRGYVVIEPEFRGSVGYGDKLFRAGFKQWGQAMQDDVQDALNWAIGKGWVDKERACIAGASYGGYAALMGLVRHPESYRCAVAWVAVTDPRLLLKWSFASDTSDDAREYDLPALLGDPVKDLAMLESVTPVLHAQRIKAPVLLAMGAADRRVPLEHGHRMRSALTEAGNPPEWLLYNDEGHGFFKAENRIDFMQRMESFLSKQLHPR